MFTYGGVRWQGERGRVKTEDEMARSKAMRAALIAISANVFLLVLKAIATGLSDSLTIFSETLNSLADVVSAIVILICVRWAWLSPDEDHPFGHRRAEPIAGLIVAIFTGILGFEVCKTAVLDLYGSRLPENIGTFPIFALIVTAVMKIRLYYFFRARGEKLNSPGLRAAAVDCRNDVLVAMQGLVAVVVAEYRIPLFDVLSALLIGVYILYSAHRVGMENLDYLMGRAPDEEMLECIKGIALDVDGVRAVRSIKGHYVGTFIHVELTAVVDGKLSTTASHDVCEATRAAVENLGQVDRAFVHISPARESNLQEARPASA